MIYNWEHDYAVSMVTRLFNLQWRTSETKTNSKLKNNKIKNKIILISNHSRIGWLLSVSYQWSHLWKHLLMLSIVFAMQYQRVKCLFHHKSLTLLTQSRYLGLNTFLPGRHQAPHKQFVSYCSILIKAFVVVWDKLQSQWYKLVLFLY